MSTQAYLLATTRHTQGYKKNHIVKEQHPVSIMTLAPLKKKLWGQGASFYQLSNIMINISESHSIPDIITAVSNDIPIST